jgi:hypothetical protein
MSYYVYLKLDAALDFYCMNEDVDVFLQRLLLSQLLQPPTHEQTLCQMWLH